MFANKVVLVTGGSGGIGAVTAKFFAKEGASVALVGRNEAKLKEVAKVCGANSLTIKADVTKDAEAKTIVQQTVDKFGKLDVLVNNAGIMRFATIFEPNLLEKYDEVMGTNLRPAIHLTNLAVPHLKQTKGNVVNVSSVASTYIRIPSIMPYCISKAALDHFTRFAAKELAACGVRVNSVNPGPVLTDILATAGDAPDVMQLDNFPGITALGRCSDVDEVSDMILYLASDKARGITGSCFVMDNGILLK